MTSGMSNPSIFIPERSCIGEIVYREDGDSCINVITYDVSIVDVYMVKENSEMFLSTAQSYTKN